MLLNIISSLSAKLFFVIMYMGGTMIKEKLYKLLDEKKDAKYRDFSKKLTPGDFTMLGVRVPDMRKIAKNLTIEERESIIKLECDDIFEFKLIRGLVVADIKDVDKYKYEFERFLPLIDNWAICDIFIGSSKIIKKDLEYFFQRCTELIKKDDEFLNRVAFVILLNYYLIDEYIDKTFDLIKDFKSDKYYANMALGWLISYLYIKYPTKTQEFLTNCNLDKTVLKMGIRKIKDSYRVSPENKEWLKKIG